MWENEKRINHMEEVRKRMTFYGRVQGVGFRYTAKHLAHSLGLTGWVETSMTEQLRWKFRVERR